MSDDISQLSVETLPLGGYVVFRVANGAGMMPLFACSTLDGAVAFIARRLHKHDVQPLEGLSGVTLGGLRGVPCAMPAETFPCCTSAMPAETFPCRGVPCGGQPVAPFPARSALSEIERAAAPVTLADDWLGAA